MFRDDFQRFVAQKVIDNERKIVSKGEESDEIALGALLFYTSLINVMTAPSSSKISKRELGLLKAVNDVLQYLTLVEKKQTFYDL